MPKEKYSAGYLNYEINGEFLSSEKVEEVVNNTIETLALEEISYGVADYILNIVIRELKSRAQLEAVT